MARSFQAQQIADRLLNESDGYDIRMLNRRDGSVDVAVLGPRRAVKLGKVIPRGNAWKVGQVLHNLGRAARCRLDGYFGSAKKAASCLAISTAHLWKPVIADQSMPDDIREAEEPTDAQKEAGNYKKEHRRWEGFEISIENEKGSTRSGTSQGGETWSVKMPADYGYFRRTEGKDGDHVDCYIGDTEDAHYCYVVDQIDHESKKFDEHKCLICFPDLETALETYKKGFSDGKGEQRIGEVTTMTVDEFKDWLHDGNTTKPVAWKRTLKESEDIKDFLLAMPELDHNIYSALGEPIRKSRNLRGIRQHISRNLVNRVNIYPLGDHEGVMEIVFANGDYHRGRWASYDMIRHALRNWRNLYGATLFINGVPAGQVRYQNPKLMENENPAAKDAILNSGVPAQGDYVYVKANPSDEYTDFYGTVAGFKDGFIAVDGGDYGTWLVDVTQIELEENRDQLQNTKLMEAFNDEVEHFLKSEEPFSESEKEQIARAVKKAGGDRIRVSDTRVGGLITDNEDDRFTDRYEFSFGKEHLLFWAEASHTRIWVRDLNRLDAGDPDTVWHALRKSTPGESAYDFAWRVIEETMAN